MHSAPPSSSFLPLPHQLSLRYLDSARSSTTRVDFAAEAEMERNEPVPEAPTPDNQEDVVPAADAQPEPEPEPPAIPQTPQTTLTFLLVSGRRRTMAFDPANTVGRVKELVWNAWPSDAEWQAERPPAPAYLRILYLGKILQDDDTLTKLAFPAHLPPAPSDPTPPPPPTIVHLSIRAYAPPSEDAPKKKKSLRRRGTANNTSTESDGAAAPSGGDDDDAGGCCSGCIIC
ncbi:ubiquitin-like protein 3 [Favolaschia claudopus]|uniref:Ubiquitin-like protein 3 n=1 Tax=Favolaschia claudopus TaxID=2862362 RepID=A0AAW0EBP7_9AGAR